MTISPERRGLIHRGETRMTRSEAFQIIATEYPAINLSSLKRKPHNKAALYVIDVIGDTALGRALADAIFSG